MSKTSKPNARTISVTLTEEEIRALDAVITTAGQANYEWAKNGGGEDAESEAKAIETADATLGRLRGAFEITKPRLAVRCTCDNGNTWATDFNGTLADARAYYLNRTFTVENVNTGKEHNETVVSVNPIK
jgi:hypothetical protein